jgi:heme exporter protein D
MTHSGYILAAYLASAVVLLGLIAWVALDLRAQKRKLAALGDPGLRRRPEAPL